MPRTTDHGASERKRRREQNGYSPYELARHIKDLAPTKKGLSRSVTKQHEFAIDQFDKMIALLPKGSLTVQGSSARCFQDFVDLQLPFPKPKVVEAFIAAYCDSFKSKKCGGRKSQSGLPQQKAAVKLFAAFCAAFSHRTGRKVCDVDQRLGKDAALSIAKRYGFADEPVQQPLLDSTSISALQSGMLDPGILGQMGLKDRLGLVAVTALLSVTFARPSTFVKPANSGTVAERQGARYGNFSLWAIPRKDGNAGNDIGGYYSPSWGKTSAARDQAYPLPFGGETMLMQPSILVLVKLVLDGCMSVQDFASFFESSYTHLGTPRRIIFKPEWRKRLVFETTHSRPMTVSLLSAHLGELSIALGFDNLVRGTTFRYAGAQAMDAQKYSLSDIREALTHLPHSKATKHYLSRKVLQDAGQEQDKDSRGMARAMRNAERPDPRAPRILGELDRNIVRSQPAIVQAANDVDQLMMDGASTSDVQRAKAGFKQRENNAQRRLLVERKKEHSEAKKSGQLVLAGVSSDAADNALDQPPVGDAKVLVELHQALRRPRHDVKPLMDILTQIMSKPDILQRVRCQSKANKARARTCVSDKETDDYIENVEDDSEEEVVFETEDDSEEEEEWDFDDEEYEEDDDEVDYDNIPSEGEDEEEREEEEYFCEEFDDDYGDFDEPT